MNEFFPYEQKTAAATNEPMTQLSAKDILQILNAPPQPPTTLTSLPGTDMIPVPVTSLPSNPQPGTSAQSVFSTADPPLPVPPPGLLQHAQDLLKRHEASKSHTEEQAIAQPFGSATSRKEEEEEMEVIDDDDEIMFNLMMVMIMMMTKVMMMMGKGKERRST